MRSGRDRCGRSFARWRRACRPAARGSSRAAEVQAGRARVGRTRGAPVPWARGCCRGRSCRRWAPDRAAWRRPTTGKARRRRCRVVSWSDGGLEDVLALLVTWFFQLRDVRACHPARPRTGLSTIRARSRLTCVGRAVAVRSDCAALAVPRERHDTDRQRASREVGAAASVGCLYAQRVCAGGLPSVRGSMERGLLCATGREPSGAAYFMGVARGRWPCSCVKNSVGNDAGRAATAALCTPAAVSEDNGVPPCMNGRHAGFDRLPVRHGEPQ